MKLLEQGNREIRLPDVLLMLVTNIYTNKRSSLSTSGHAKCCLLVISIPPCFLLVLCPYLPPASALASSSHRESGVFSPAVFSILFTYFLNFSNTDVNQAGF